MDFVTAIHHVIKFVIGLLLALLPIYTTMAQEPQAPKQEKKVRIKYFKNENGKQVMIDTTLTITDQAILLEEKLLGMKVDTAALRKLNSISSKRYRIDSIRVAEFKRGDFKVMHLSDSLGRNARVELIKQLNAAAGDSAIKALLQNGVLRAARLDTARALYFKRNGDAKATQIRVLNGDSVRVFRLGGRDTLKFDRNIKVERIFLRDPKNAPGDTFLLRSNVKVRRLSAPGDSIRELIVYEVEGTGGNHTIQRLENGQVALVLKTKATVKDLTTEDVKSLQKSGTPVETKSKEELEFDQISYYPNPSDGRFKLEFKPENKGTTVVKVLNSKGEEVFVDKAENLKGVYSKEIDLRPFGTGLYFLQIAQGKRYHTKKILVR